MSYTELLYAVTERVATITLNRPDRMNAWTPTMEAEFRVAIAAASADDEVRAIVVTGAGRGFCAGADMGRLQNSAAGAAPLAAPPSGEGNFDQRYSYLLAVPKPLIAAINGSVAGVGLCITLYCDLRFMAEGARLATSFARRGLVAEHGSAWMLPRLIGPMNAADLLLSGRTVDAAEAASLGLVRMLPAERFLAAVQARAAEFANLSSPRSMRIIKQQLQAAPFQSLAEATRFADAEIPKCRDTEDFKEGVASFVEKRAPNFTGR
jgi:enoyl-CoA hydratase/carnithine racemase